MEAFRQQLLAEDAERHRVEAEAARKKALEDAERAATRKRERHERRKKAGIEKTRRHNAAKKLEAERKRRARLGLPPPGETSSEASEIDDDQEEEFFDASASSIGSATTGNDEIEDSDEDSFVNHRTHRKRLKVKEDDGDKDARGSCCCGLCCCCTSVGSCLEACVTCGGECDVRECRDCADENCCGCCSALLGCLYYSSCSCCLVPFFRKLRRSWPVLVLVVMAIAFWVAVEVRKDDVSSMLVTLQNGQVMPLVALGTWQIQSGWRLARAVRVAVEEGYRHIDAAAVYGNEKSLGAALHRELSSGAIRREELFITSKLWNSDHDPDRVELACRRTLKDLQLDYLDLYLMHWPTAFRGGDERFPRNPKTGRIMYGKFVEEEETGKETGVVAPPVHFVETYEAMERLVRKGLVRSIGVSNFNETQITDLLQMATFAPQVLQIENHPYLPQKDLVAFAQARNIVVQAYSPLGSPGRPPAWDAGRYDVPPNLLDHEGIAILRDLYGKTPAQILLKYQLQRGNAVVVKSATPARIQSNADLFSWEISEYDMSRIGRMSNVDWRYCQPQEFDEQERAWFIRDLAHPFFPFADEVSLKKEEEEERRVYMANFEKKQEEKRKRGEPTLPADSKIGLTADIQDEMEKFQRRIFTSDELQESGETREGEL
jgi:diketogulonate reductase-like aldo/keto reductase